MAEEKDLVKEIATEFAQLPKVVQDAILSGEVEKHMRALAEDHSLHFDQWTGLENEVMFALLGMEPIESLTKNLVDHVDIEPAMAAALTEDISTTIFKPIRAKLEEALNAQEAARRASITAAFVQNQEPPKPVVVPGTPPPPPPKEKAIRPAVSEKPVAGEASADKKGIVGDPYREVTIP